MIPFQDNRYYALVAITLTLGFITFIMIPIGIHYHNWWSDWLLGKSRFYSIGFFVGALAATIQNSIHFAKEINSLASKPDDHIKPSAYDFFGHLLKMTWGGIAAVMFALAVKTGFLASFESTNSEMNIESLLVVSFVVGLNAFGMLRRLAGIKLGG
ncbi:hypothetical protein [Ekhidna sp. To15]|uniref:hypothetical protein n=1 Tax=Ekhidna sp. To15 TaxID=3395267 RepID=UPI003F525349